MGDYTEVGPVAQIIAGGPVAAIQWIDGNWREAV